ncbi:hypothetical protein S7335_2339 [Synechococcus sp. PCC 7335]|nr:hypothetical protein S7335_2339 [Synechococcus sp. PCC 7335]
MYSDCSINLHSAYTITKISITRIYRLCQTKLTALLEYGTDFLPNILLNLFC